MLKQQTRSLIGQINLFYFHKSIYTCVSMTMIVQALWS